MKKYLVLILIGTVLFVSCVSTPSPVSPGTAVQQQSSAAETTNTSNKDRAKELVTGTSSAAGSSTATSTAASTSTASTIDVPPPLPGVLSAEEEAYLTNYLARLQYMVYYDEAAGIEPDVAKSAVAQANRYLISILGLTVVDAAQIEKNKKDQKDAYEAETGGSMDFIQYIAQKNNADVYVEVSFKPTTEQKNGIYYASVQGSMKLFDTSTAQLLGSVAFASPLVRSADGTPKSAVIAATAASVWNSMPKMIEQSKMLVKNSLSQGVRYEITIQNTPDSKMISAMRRALAKNVRLVEQNSYSPASTVMYLFSFKSKEKIEDAIYDAAERSGMNDIRMVFSRGKAFTFNSGL